jgi:hypothetical protein
LNDCKALAKLPPLQAGMAFIEERRAHIGKRMASDYEMYLTTLALFFNDPPLETLANPDKIRAFQLHRSKTCKATTVTHELSVLQQLLKRIRRWHQGSTSKCPPTSEEMGQACAKPPCNKLL